MQTGLSSFLTDSSTTQSVNQQSTYRSKIVVNSFTISTVFQNLDSNGLNFTKRSVIVDERTSWIAICAHRWFSRSSKLATKTPLRNKWKNFTKSRECLQLTLMLKSVPSRIVPYLALKFSVFQSETLQPSKTRRVIGRTQTTVKTARAMAFEAFSDSFSLSLSAFTVFRIENNESSKQMLMKIRRNAFQNRYFCNLLRQRLHLQPQHMNSGTKARTTWPLNNQSENPILARNSFDSQPIYEKFKLNASPSGKS